MTTITFTHGATIEVERVHLNEAGDTVFAGGGHNWDAYELFGVKSIIPPKVGAPTHLQNFLTKHLQSDGYFWDKSLSVASAGVVLKRADGDFWFFGMEGEIMHNPDGISIPVPKTNEKKWKWYRFYTDSEDWRPIQYNKAYPSWKSGTTWSNTESVKELSVVVAYLPVGVKLTDYWPEATDVEMELCDGPVFTDRFPKPNDYVPVEL